MSITAWKYDSCCFFDHDYGSREAANYSVLGQYIVFGDLSAKFRVMCFGGSTTSTLQGSRWVQLLSECLKREGYDVCLLNGGCGGHNSWHEMNKLIRDVGSFKPSLVISFSGINDAAAHTDPNNTYINTKGLQEIVNNAGLFTGVVVPTTMDTHAVAFARRTKIMRSACKDVGAEFERILQPTLGIGEYLADKNDELDAKCQAQLKTDHEKFGYLHMLNSFYPGVKEEIAKEPPGFIQDFSGIFNGKSRLYADFRHPNEHGYAIIAEQIGDLVKSHVESKS
jgi:lysophospholipase L1-like esterase